MCGIVGYVGAQSALDVVLGGLRKLEPPSYDAAGVAVLVDGGLASARTAGRLPDLTRLLERSPLPSGSTGIGHLRRGTRGPATESSAHPQLDNAGRIAVVHNGTLGNGDPLRAELADRGHELTSGTDTEAVAHLLAEAVSACGDPAEAMRQVCGRLDGAYAVAAVHADAPDTLVGARNGLPLLAGLGDGECLLASDRAVLADGPWEVVEPADTEVLVLRRENDELSCELLPADAGLPGGRR